MNEVLEVAKTRYSDEELEEFRIIIMEKLEKARYDYEHHKNAVNNASGNGTNDTSPSFKVLEEGRETLAKEENTTLANRQ